MGAESEGLRPTSVMIVDDQRYARLGLALMIRKAPDLYVVAEAGDGQEALEVLEGLNRSTGLPDVVLMDVRMPGMDGISATRAMARRFPTVKVLVLTTYDEDDYAFGALEVGASGFLLKDVRAAQLAQAVRAVTQGDAVLTPRVTKELIARGVPRVLPGAQREGLRERFGVLTPRELDVARLIAEGMSNEEIAERLVESCPRTCGLSPPGVDRTRPRGMSPAGVWDAVVRGHRGSLQSAPVPPVLGGAALGSLAGRRGMSAAPIHVKSSRVTNQIYFWYI